ncbi:MULTISPECIES: Rieske (2Fe-2S) protein [unclassified Mucilaginibacter]|uniref:Rieske (2Fe-2S) protein n=1 Tax=unclassified Mucilaginibacter TaxID=2617802 RepID=UPI002AC8E83A|nr:MULTISPECIES: Rieske (2Fe-2S) protein [unclassified Mucilaginibacter]MEB0262338.1 Rieske (2Fe-2S) protein [Mucilaginibacter sp. 10I4]MEB0279985.1 Rieske (2Fe-2S) protein [Mucilaginibacter sp. 10B2]MEB0302630.1 Rieske (2Fe-2S) protein [Mucilaginibacter sp. 5C4]WPX21942.1 Rieske (2Fe-2S) protein [Mucilaginibacter sp. 5C4]
MKWYPVPGLELNGQPFIKKVKVSGKDIIIIGYENELYALGSICPHAREDLSRGWCADGKLVCPYHRFSYDLQTGNGSPGQNDYVDSYAIAIRAGEVHVGIENFWDKFKLSGMTNM